MSDKILATVITYNRKFLLEKCVNAIQNQTLTPTDVLVVDNASTDNTDVFMLKNCPDIKYVKLENNVGSAGGQHYALKYGYENGYDFVWTMDDDGLPDRHCLEYLYNNNLGGKNCIFNSIVLDIANQDLLAFGIYDNGKLINSVNGINKTIIEGWISPFNSTLIHRSVIDKIGYPKPELFIWGDEQEYFFRAKKMGVSLYTITKSIIEHPSSSKNMMHADIELEDCWKLYYLVRNLKFYQKHKYNVLLVYPINIATFAYYIYHILLYQKTNKFRKIKLITIAYIHGLFGYLEFTITDVRKLLSDL